MWMVLPCRAMCQCRAVLAAAAAAAAVVATLCRRQVDHVEIDPVVIQAAKDFLPTIWAHPYAATSPGPASLRAARGPVPMGAGP